MNNLAEKEFYTVVVGASVLALNAGVINGEVTLQIQFNNLNRKFSAISMAGPLNVAVAHVTGNLTKLAIGITELNGDVVLAVASIVVCFMFGSFMGGFIVGDSKFRLGRSYGIALIIESFTLFISYLLLLHDNIAGAWFATFSCGLQNALTTNYSGAVVRTTHMTGISTDIANLLGQSCRKDSHPELWRLKVHIPLLLSFLFGAITGKGLFYFMGVHAMVMPSIFAGSVGVIYLMLPYIRQAKEVLIEANKLLVGQIPGFEIRIIGDPKKAKHKVEMMQIMKAHENVYVGDKQNIDLHSTESIHLQAINSQSLAGFNVISVDQRQYESSPIINHQNTMVTRIANIDEAQQNIPAYTDSNTIDTAPFLTMNGGGAFEVIYSSPIAWNAPLRDSSAQGPRTISMDEGLLTEIKQ
ncbi:hypothetical protein HK096_004223 [Nowakowskiella sp. JEL0078]|nr:hypothetical protein HK096_004223 [Nowakowskiella sp. JEL0078]